jgi:two-component system response regulator
MSVEILLVEDDPNDVELTMHAFDKYRLSNHVDVVRDGQEALDYLFRNGAYANRPPVNPRLVLLDVKLPKLNGLEVLARIRDDPRTKGVPVVMLTSSREDRDINQGYALGINSYIVKPVDFAQFAEAVRTLGMYWLVLNTPPPGS